MASNYAGGQYKEYTAMLRQRMSELPSFCAEFFRGIENETLVRTRCAYAGDLRNFFRFVTTELLLKVNMAKGTGVNHFRFQKCFQ